MRSLKVLVVGVFLLVLVALNLAAMVVANEIRPPSTYSAGIWLYDGSGQKMGCDCPRMYGECICSHTPQS